MSSKSKEGQMEPRVESIVDQESVRWIDQGGQFDGPFYKAAYTKALAEARDDLARRQAQEVGRRSREVFVLLGFTLTLFVSLLFAGVADFSLFIALGVVGIGVLLARLGILLVEPSKQHRSDGHDH